METKDMPQDDWEQNKGANYLRSEDGPSRGYGAARQPQKKAAKKAGDRKDTDRYTTTD